MTINKQKLAKLLKEQLDCSHVYALKIINAYTDIIFKELLQDNKVILQGIGVLNMVTRKERVGVSPQDFSPLMIPAKKCFTLKNFATVKKFLNSK